MSETMIVPETLAAQLIECAAAVKRGQVTPQVRQTLRDLHAFVQQTKTNKKPSTLTKTLGKIVGMTESSTNKSQTEASKKEPHPEHAKTWLAGHHDESEWCEKCFTYGCSCQVKTPRAQTTATVTDQQPQHPSKPSAVPTTATSTPTSTAKPSFQTPSNPKSPLLANGWIEQQRRSRMRTVWKDVLASLVQGRKPGEETTLWIQREISLGPGKVELEALHQIPVKWIESVEYVDYSVDQRFNIKVYNIDEVFTFRCREAEAAQNWVATLVSARDAALQKHKKTGKEDEEEKKTTDSLEQHESNRMQIKELRAIAHGAGINTHGMERPELERIVAQIQSASKTTNEEAERRRKLDEARRGRQQEKRDEEKVSADEGAKPKAEEEESRRAAEEEALRVQKEIEEEHRRRMAEHVKQQQELERRKREEEERRRLEQERLKREEDEIQRRLAEKRAAEERRRQEEAQRLQQEQWMKQQEAWKRQQAEEEERRRVAQQRAEEERRKQEEAYKRQQWQQPPPHPQSNNSQNYPPHGQYWQQQTAHRHQSASPPPHFQQQQYPHHPGSGPNQHYPHAPSPPPTQGGYPQHNAGNQQPPPGASSINQKYAKMANQTDDGGQASIQHIKHGILVEWALLPPMMQILRPIDTLITTIHTVFPPKLNCPGHEYFSKWTPITRDEIFSSPGRPDDEKLKKCIRKLRFFLHPDKLPRDFTPEQVFICKMLWDITSDAWEEHKKKEEDLGWIRG